MRSAQKIYWTLQLCGWTAYAVLIFLSAWSSGEKITPSIWLQLGINLIINVLVSHMMRYAIIRFNWFHKHILTIVLNVSLMCIGFGFLIELLSATLNQIILTPEKYTFPSASINALGYSIVLYCWNGIYFTYLFFQKSKNQEVQTINLKATKNEMQLKNLRNQLNPHFLFNALNSIRALVDLEPQTAKSAITQLSNLLRKSLLLGDQNFIHIEQELEIVKHYLELEQMRFEERLRYTINVVDQSLLQEDVPPFLIQNLVENAIKHGISKEIEGGEIKISIDRVDERITITIANTGTLVKSDQAGIGIDNTRQRLQLLYDNATFYLHQKDEMVVATIQF